MGKNKPLRFTRNVIEMEERVLGAAKVEYERVSFGAQNIPSPNSIKIPIVKE